MTAATDVVPVVYIPPQARRALHREATVLTLHAPSADSVAPPLRLTRRGVAVLASAVAVVCAALIGLAWASAPAGRPAAPAPAVVTVRAGDTLWSIASRVAPGRDPRDEVAQLQRVNHLTGAALVAGQELRTGN